MRLAVLAAGLALAGCLGAVEAPPEEVAAAEVAAPTVLGSESFDGRFTFVVNYLYNPFDPAFFRAEFPEGYREALLEMTWTPSAPTNRELSLMLHERGAAGADGMLAEVAGPSPLRLVVQADEVPPGDYDVVAYVPMDGRTPLVVAQDFRLYATWFDGAVPEGFTATG